MLKIPKIKTNRPKLEIPLEPLDYLLDIAALLILVFLGAYTLMHYADLSATIPTHYNASGVADAFGEKHNVWVLPGLGLVLFVGMYLLTKYPHIHNYMVNITKENAFKNYRFSCRILRVSNLFCLLLFTYIQYVTIQKGLGNPFDIGSWFFPVVLGSSLLLPIVILIYHNKLNKS